jgi:hypothetical protein
LDKDKLREFDDDVGSDSGFLGALLLLLLLQLLLLLLLL